MGKRTQGDPPSNWAGASLVGHGVYWRYDPNEGPAGTLESIVVWHWCPTGERWHAAHVGHHTLVNADPLHLEPSLLWNCCGKHGWIRDGQWTPA